MLKSPTINEFSRYLAKKQRPLSTRYKEIMTTKARNLQKLEFMQRYEEQFKHPEDYNPSFKPDLSQSQSQVGFQYTQGFDEFISKVSNWKTSKDRKLEQRRS